MDYYGDIDIDVGQDEGINQTLKPLKIFKAETAVTLHEENSIDFGLLSLRNVVGKKPSPELEAKGKRPEMSSNCIILSNDSDGDMLDEGSAVAAAEIDQQATTKRRECLSCTAKYPMSDTIRTQCAHIYCRKCVLRLFENSLTNESLFPPQCCRIPIRISTAVEDIIGLEMAKRYEERKIEISETARTYCSKPTCSRYIPPKNIRRGVGICDSCTERTCVECKKQRHRGDCEIEPSEDEHSEHLLERLAKRRKWQRCTKCSQIIEHTAGCWHIKCPCGMDFCYVCGKVWKSCGCSSLNQWRFQARPLKPKTKRSP